MEISLKSIRLTNFKGIRSFETNFSHTTNVYGINGSGKTTLLDAFLWLLFGKDSTDRKDFEIKTLDENNQPFHRLDHEVAAVLMVNGMEVNLRRVYKEKWTKKRGSSDSEFTGHETNYYWNDVPMQQKEFGDKITEMLNEGIFKLITNVTYFNNLKWQDRRAVLLQIAGKIEDADVFKSLAGTKQGDFEDLIFNLGKGKTLDEYKREVIAKKKKLKDELLLLPSRIAEANLAMPEPLDYAALEKDAEVLRQEIATNDELINSKTAAQKQHNESINQLLNRKQDLNKSCMEIVAAAKNNILQSKLDRESKIIAEKNELKKLVDERSNDRTTYANLLNTKKEIEAEQTKLREKWTSVDAEKLEFNENDFCCPTCKRAYDNEDVESKKQSLTENFNADKSNRLLSITNRGKELGVELSDINTKISNLTAAGEARNQTIATIESRIAELETEHIRLMQDDAAAVEQSLSNNKTYQDLLKEIASIDEAANTPFNGSDNSALQLIKKTKSEQLQTITAQLATQDQAKKQLVRIQELQSQEESMNQELSSLEGIEFSIEQFTKAKMEMLESRINNKFQLVKFKMFEEQINGGEVEACTTLINGVPYSDANTASKIQAGVDIINTLSEHYDVKAPVWIDNRESVIELPETSCQLINLFVSASHKKLKVETSKEAAAVA